MPGRDIVVIGSSAGGLKGLTAIVGNLPGDFDAAILIVQHIPPERRSMLPAILRDLSRFPVVHPQDNDRISTKRIYVAPPDHHLMVDGGSIRVVRGPRENRFRPSIDTLFRSAARTFGSRVIGVVLSGYLDDGTVGLQAIKRRGGIAVVQDPEEAEFPSMPQNALRYATVDHCLALADIPDLLTRLTKEPPPDDQAFAISKEVEIETNIAELHMNTEQLINGVESIGARTFFTCPTCNGALWQIGNDEPLRFRCHIGHSFTADALMADQTRNLENALSSAVRLMEEKVMMSRRMAERRRAMNMPAVAEPYEEYASQLDQEVVLIRQLLLNGNATRYVAPDEERDGMEEQK